MTDNDDDETMDALGELFREEKVNMDVPADPDEEANFSLTDEGTEAAREILRENDQAVLMVATMQLESMERSGDSEAVSRQLIDLGAWLRDDSGVNLFRVLRRNPEAMPTFQAEDLPEEFLEVFDP
jgi:hypothetical protein